MKNNIKSVQSKTPSVIALALLACGLSIVLNAQTIWDDYMCETGSVHYSCEDSNNCEGGCVMTVSTSPRSSCTAHPGGQCANLGGQEPIAVLLFHGTCTGPDYNYNCGCQVNAGTEGIPGHSVAKCIE
jgi:hypothetical protein